MIELPPGVSLVAMVESEAWRRCPVGMRLLSPGGLLLATRHEGGTLIAREALGPVYNMMPPNMRHVSCEVVQ